LASSRTEYLGLQQLLKSSDEDDEDDKTVKVQGSSLASNLSDSLNLGRWKRDYSASQKHINLERYIVKSIGPFAELLGNKRFFMSDTQPASVDSVILGFLGLIFGVQASNSWAVDIIKQKYSALGNWLDIQSQEVFLKS
jgi:hypothetical protein